jgi:hypothetical protein
MRRYRWVDLLTGRIHRGAAHLQSGGQKMCQNGSVRVSGAKLLFPITYICGDIFVQVWSTMGQLILGSYLTQVVYETVATPASARRSRG